MKKTQSAMDLLCLVLKGTCCTGCRCRPFTAEAPLIGKINPFSKVTVTFEPVKRFGCPSGFRISKKLDGVGPVDNRPSTDKLHNFVQKKL